MIHLIKAFLSPGTARPARFRLVLNKSEPQWDGYWFLRSLSRVRFCLVGLGETERWFSKIVKDQLVNSVYNQPWNYLLRLLLFLPSIIARLFIIKIKNSYGRNIMTGLCLVDIDIYGKFKWYLISECVSLTASHPAVFVFLKLMKKKPEALVYGERKTKIVCNEWTENMEKRNKNTIKVSLILFPSLAACTACECWINSNQKRYFSLS